MRLIDADALLEVVEKYQSKLKEFNPAHDYLDDVTDLITNAPTVQREGWVSVPIEITEDMHIAAVKTLQRCTGNDDFPHRVYKAMIQAAPTDTE